MDVWECVAVDEATATALERACGHRRHPIVAAALRVGAACAFSCCAEGSFARFGRVALQRPMAERRVVGARGRERCPLAS